MTAVIVSLVAVVLLVLLVVALGMRSMNRRESALPAERLREMAEKEASTPTRSTDEFAAREPKMDHFTPDLSPFDEPKPRPPRPSGARGKRGVNEFGEPDDYDDDYWTRLQADEGGFGGPLAARMGASRPLDQEDGVLQADADAVTVQAPLPSRPQRPVPAPEPAPAPPPQVSPAAASLPSGLADLVGPVQPNPAPSAATLAEQKTVTFAAPTPGSFGESRTPRSSRRGGRASASNAQNVQSAANPLGVPGGGASRPDPLNDPLGGSYSRGAGSSSGLPVPGAPSGPIAHGGTGIGPALPPLGPTTSGGFPATTPGADPLATPYGSAPEPPSPVADNPWAQATTPGSGGWAAVNTADILDDPGPSYSSYQTPVYSAPPPGSYEVSSGWATIEDDALTGPSPAVSTSPSRAVSPYDRPADTPSGASGGYGYETGSYVSPATPAAPAAWPEPAPAPPGGGNWPSYGDLYGTNPESTSEGRSHAGSRGSHHRNQEPDYPDYYR
ncbi:hypothetical protein [Planomonospora venezuelensis]|uniref:Uncharacterized protein n=1 Tax=Planomonospora venezuelensis TaxID=1999 RepID=A0A841D5M9_PLAVE|nr:hypothetical protein [Planomonospora venezuelensis]MBB5964253.1 hypothetical protein [Planomonospora venezuelensis]GIN02570.1 hypothetical protein Pve01_42280 [Planomonospora venezuelensis]